MEFIVRHKTIVAFVFFTLFCIISLSIKSTSLTISIEGIGSALSLPFQKGYNGIINGLGGVWRGYSEFETLRNDVKSLREKLQKYESLSEEISEIKIENKRLRTVLGLKESIPYSSVHASVISKDPDNWFRTIIINRGESDGIRINMPVIAFYGSQKAVVGKIVDVKGSISRVLPIISPEFKMGVIFQENRSPGLLRGLSASSNLCNIDYVSKTANVKFGGIIVSSEQGGVFPQGLLVGTVLKSEGIETSAYQRVIVKPALDYYSIHEVFVIKKEADKELLELFKELK